MSFKHDFEWSKQKYVEKWNSIWKKNCTISFLLILEEEKNTDEDSTEDRHDYKKSAIWSIENATMDLNVWYDAIVRYQMMNKINTIIFPIIAEESDKIRHYLSNTFVCGMEMEESVCPSTCRSVMSPGGVVYGVVGVVRDVIDTGVVFMLPDRS